MANHAESGESLKSSLAARHLEKILSLIDLHVMSKTFYEALGPEGSKRAFAPGDATHHNEYGSYELAKCIVEGIKSSKLEITKYLVKDVPPFDPAHPDPPM